MYANGQGVLQDYIAAHMWFNIGGSNGAPAAIARRDAIASELSPADLSDAQLRAKACMASNFQECN
jgi:TPR repeat protein